MNNSDTSSTILQTALHNFQRSAERLNLDPAVSKRIMAPRERVEITLNPILPDGHTCSIPAYIVRHNDTIGPAKGGIRMTPSATLDDITGLAMEMTWKTSLIGVPFGGGKAGIRCDPASISPAAKEVIIRSFTRGAHRHMGPEIYVPAPDMGTNETDMGHIRDCISYSAGTSITTGCYVTGKPAILGGIVGRAQATGRGVVHTICAACEKLDLDISAARAAIQGFGNVGSVAAFELASLGTKVIAVADMSGAVRNDDGLDVAALNAHVVATGGVKGFADARPMAPDGIFAVECDILVPAAAGSQITEANASAIKARIIAEGANAPTTPQADAILDDRGVFVICDILCNAGGVFVSYLEYTQETQREQMTLSAVNERLAQRMKSRFDDVFQRARDDRSTMRQAAMDIAVSHVVDAVLARGFYP